MREHGGARLKWIGDVLVAVAYGDINEEAADTLATDVAAMIHHRAHPRWAELVFSSSTMPTPQAAQQLQQIAEFFARNGCSHCAAVNAGVVQDDIYAGLYAACGIVEGSFRALGPALDWLRAHGYELRSEDVEAFLASISRDLPASGDAAAGESSR